jgi:hypothetical protein
MSTFSEVYIPVTTTGSAGSATGSATSAVINGLLYSLYVKYHDDAPATTDVTISEDGGAARTFLTISDANTSGEYPPMVTARDATNTERTSQAIIPSLAGHGLTVTVAGADALTNAVEVYAYILE